jgi:hypothetical protein
MDKLRLRCTNNKGAALLPTHSHSLGWRCLFWAEEMEPAGPARGFANGCSLISSAPVPISGYLSLASYTKYPRPDCLTSYDRSPVAWYSRNTFYFWGSILVESIPICRTGVHGLSTIPLISAFRCKDSLLQGICKVSMLGNWLAKHSRSHPFENSSLF